MDKNREKDRNEEKSSRPYKELQGYVDSTAQTTQSNVTRRTDRPFTEI